MNDLGVRQRQQIARLYEEACAAMEAENWREAVYKLDRVVDVAPGFPGAERRHSEAYQWHQIDTQYELSHKHMDAARWSEALETLKKVREQAPTYKDTARRISMCEREILGKTLGVRQAVAAAMNSDNRLAPVVLTTVALFGCALFSLNGGLSPPRSGGLTTEALLQPTATPANIVTTPPATPASADPSRTPEPDASATLETNATPSSNPTSPGNIPPATSSGSNPSPRPPAARTPPTPIRLTATPTPTPPRGNPSTATPLPSTDTPPATAAPTIAQPTATAIPRTPGVADASDTPTPTPTRTATATRSPTPATRAVTVTTSDFRFESANLTFKAGERIRLTLSNFGAVEHAWVMRDSSNRVIARVSAGPFASNLTAFTAPVAGSYSVICDISDYAQRGMTGKVTVQ